MNCRYLLVDGIYVIRTWVCLYLVALKTLSDSPPRGLSWMDVQKNRKNLHAFLTSKKV